MVCEQSVCVLSETRVYQVVFGKNHRGEWVESRKSGVRKCASDNLVLDAI